MPGQADETAKLFAEIEKQFYAATSKAEIVEHTLEIAGQRFNLEFAGGALVERILPALSHRLLQHDGHGVSSDLTIRIWDTESTGVGAPQIPWSHDQFGARREVIGANSETYRVAYDLYCGVLSIVSLDDGMAYWWIGARDKLPLYESAAPLREILQAWFDHTGGMFVHAAAIGNESGAVLLVGRGGSGKTTTAVASVADDLRLIGEDYCLLTGFEESEIRVNSLYCSAKLTEQSLDLLPQFRPLVINADRQDRDGKAIVMFGEHFPMLASAPVKAVVLPIQSGFESMRIAAASQKDALMGMAPSTILQLTGMEQNALSAMKQVANSVPTYRLDLGKRPGDAAGHLEKLIADEA